MPGDYGYANARLRAMGGRLLSAGEYEALMARETVGALISALTATAYKEAIEAGLLHASGIQAVVEALRLDVARTFRKVAGFFETGEPQQLIDILLSRWDLHNVRAIVRGQVAQATVSSILETVMPAGQLDKATLESMAQQPGLQATVDLMLTQGLPYAHPLTSAMRTYHGREDLAALELHLDRYHYASALANLSPGSTNADLVRDMVQTEIDCTNLATFLRLYRDVTGGEWTQELTQANWFIPDGKLSKRCWDQLTSAQTVDEIGNSLAGTSYKEIVESGLREGPTEALRQIERYMIREGIGMWYGDPLSIAIAIGYMWAKTTEVMNLRLIAYAVSGELGREAAREELIVWRN